MSFESRKISLCMSVSSVLCPYQINPSFALRATVAYAPKLQRRSEGRQEINVGLAFLKFRVFSVFSSQ